VQRKKLSLYLQIEAILKSKILTGELKEGDRLAPENELSKQFGVSTLTVRQALSSLVEEGLLTRKPGIGTTVRESPAEKITLNLSGEINELLSLGLETETKEIRSEVIQSSDNSIRNLKFDLKGNLCFVEKVRYWRTIPMMVIKEYAPQSLIGEFFLNKSTRVSLYSILTQKRGIILKEATQSIEASTADQRIAPLLKIEMGSPLFYMERTFFAESAVPVLFQITFTRAEHFKIMVHLGIEQKEKKVKWVVY
jgi:GntR family transcriptional regulator